jgi:uncharacterized protein YbjT (DUF2867 family)
MRVFVCGASGHVGSAVAAAALAAGHEVRALVRDASRAPAGAEPVVGDLAEPKGFAASLAGCDGAFLLSGYAGFTGLLSAMRAAGVARVALLSSGGVGLSSVDNAVVAYHRVSEEDVRASGLDWTFLRPFSFMTNTVEWASQLRRSDRVVVPFAYAPVAVVDPADIAAVAVAALTTPGHSSRAYRLSGPAALTAGERLAVIGAALERPLELVAQPDDDAYAEMSARMPREYVDSFFDIFVRGAYDEGAVQSGVRDAIGRPPRSFASWVADHVDTFR